MRGGLASSGLTSERFDGRCYFLVAVYRRDLVRQKPGPPEWENPGFCKSALEGLLP